MIRRWFTEHPEWNVGLVTGAVGKIVVVDADSLEALAWAVKNLPATPMQVVTRKGKHLYFAHPGIDIRNGVKLRGMPLDVRGDGGYVAAPDTVHWTGHVYRWLEEPTKEMLQALPVANPAWFAEERKFKPSTIAVDAVEKRIRVVPYRRCSTPIDLIRQSKGRTAVTNCFAIAKLLAAEPAGFGLTVSEAMPIIVAYNARAVPPFSDKEIEHKIASVLAKVQKTVS